MLISADQNQDNALSLNEFIDLIFSTNDALNVDLSKVAPIQINPDSEADREKAAETWHIENIRKDAEWLKLTRGVN